MPGAVLGGRWPCCLGLAVRFETDTWSCWVWEGPGGMWGGPEGQEVAWPWVWGEPLGRLFRGDVGSQISCWWKGVTRRGPMAECVPGSETAGAKVCQRGSTGLKSSLAGGENARTGWWCQGQVMTGSTDVRWWPKGALKNLNQGNLSKLDPGVWE